MKDLVVSVVNTDNGPFLKNCLKSLREQIKDVAYEIWVVDNASADGSPEMVKREFPEVKTIHNLQKEGFSKNHNKVLKNTDAKYKLILNEDTLILDSAVNKLIAFLDDNKNAACVGPKLVFGDGSFQLSYFKQPTVLSEMLLCLKGESFNPKTPVSNVQKTGWLNGSCILFRSEALETTGYLDEKFYIFYEDADICKRLSDAGWNIYYYPEATVTHYYGKARKGKLSEKLTQAYYKSRFYYFRKHKGIFQLLCLKTGMLLIHLLKLVKWSFISVFLKKHFTTEEIIRRIKISTTAIGACLAG